MPEVSPMVKTQIDPKYRQMQIFYIPSLFKGDLIVNTWCLMANPSVGLTVNLSNNCKRLSRVSSGLLIGRLMTVFKMK